MGLGAFPAADRQWLGMLGMHGTWEANWAMHDCDVMIAVGARFDDRITGRLDAFSPGSKKIHIDIDPSSINKNVKVDLAIVGDCAHVLEDMARLWRASAVVPDKKAIEAWWAQIDKWRAKNSLAFRNSNEIIKPQYAIQRLYELTKDRDVYITTEVGQHQMWAAQFYQFQEPNRWMTSGGLGTMGYGLPAAVGVQLAHPSSLVIDIAGEASVLMTMQEMSTAVQYPSADQDLHHQQSIHGHGAAVAGTTPRQALRPFLHRGAARFRQARRGLPCARHPLHASGRARREDPRNDRGEEAGAVRLRGRSGGKLLPDGTSSGRAHNEMLLGDAAVRIEDAITEEGKVMV